MLIVVAAVVVVVVVVVVAAAAAADPGARIRPSGRAEELRDCC